jgi:uncharacterized protein
MSITRLTETIYVAPSAIDKVGIFSSQPLRSGDTVFCVTGQYVRNEFSVEFSQMGPNWIGISRELWLDPDLTNPMTFMNHSCEPNSIVTEGLKVIALRDVEAGEEIVMDYSTTEIDPFWKMDCHCNKDSCRKIIQAFQFLPADLRQLYIGLILPTLAADVPITTAAR